MVTYVSMLRGINVGGQKRIKMEELIVLYESLGFKNVKTYVQSGNVIFNSAEDVKEFSNMIEEKIRQVFSFPVAVLLRIPTELQQIVSNNPFLEEKGIDTDKLYITFLSNAPTESALSQMKEMHYQLDKFVTINKEIYLYCPNGYGRTKFSNDFFERKLGITATTRNWKTVKTLLEIAKNQSG
jgi:uncharacterized protein (DUF1697 family)